METVWKASIGLGSRKASDGGILRKLDVERVRRRRALLREQIVKMDCDRCKLQTEHYLLDYGDRPALIRCLRCGHVTTNPGFSYVNHEPYPIDDRRPIYIV